MAAVCLPIGGSPHAQQAILTGHATVTDGDTIRIGGIGIRLKGVAAPELKEPGGKEARAALTAIIDGREVRCRLTGERTHDRAVAFPCKIGNLDLNAAMVRGGWAKACPAYSTAYVRHEAAPRKLGLGVWGSGYPLPAYCSPR